VIRHDAGDEPSQGIGPAASADLGPSPPAQLAVPAPPPSQWQFSFTPYLWLPWMTGDVVVKGRTLDVSVDPAQLIDHLDWPVILPAWMSHAEARRGPLKLIQRHRLGRCHRLGRLQQDVPRQESGRDIRRRYRR